MSKAIFISHAAADAPLVRKFVDFLMEGIGVSEDDIFCSSLEGMGIPTGKNFVEYVRGEIIEPKVVIMMITPSYQASLFCIAEMGAAWVKGHDVFPVIVPPASYNDMKAVMLGTQAMMIDNDIGVNELREKLIAATGCKPASLTRWDLKRKEFFGNLPQLTAAMENPKTVEPSVHEELQAKYQEALREIEYAEDRIELLNAQVDELKKLKNAKAVSKVMAQFSDHEVVERFEEAITNAKLTLQELGSAAVRRKILADYYQQPFDTTGEDREDFNKAIRRKILDEDGALNRRSAAVTELAGHLDAIQELLAEHGDGLEAHANEHYKSPLEPDNEDFWDEHLL